MAGDDSISQMIFFIVSIAVAGALAATFIGLSWSIGVAIDDQGDRLVDRLDTDMAIINDPTVVPYSTGNLTIYVKNLGEKMINPASLSVFVDGEYRSFSYEVMGADDDWDPGDDLTLWVVATLGSGDHHARVTTENAVSDTMDFRMG